jgi:predicted nucleotidyltransferase
MEPKTVEALRALSRILSQEGRRFVLIGATVPQIVAKFRELQASGSRETRDVDAVTEVATWDDFANLQTLLEQEGFRQSQIAHEFIWDGEVRIDLIPFSAALVEQDRLLWPGGGAVMSVCGLEEALECAREEEITPDLKVPVVTIPGLVLTKTIAYMDRPEARVRDLIDILYCFAHYDTRQGESRRFDLAGTVVNGVPLMFDEAGAYLLGIEVTALAKPNSLIIARRFVEIFSDEFARPISQILAEEKRLMDNDARRATVYRLFQVFGAGIYERGKR